MLHYILELFTENNNAIDITKRLQEKYNRNNLDNRFIYHFISTIRNYIAHFYHDKYTLEKLAYLGENKKCAIDESLFVHIDGKQLWVIGIIDTQSLNIRIEVSFDRGTATMKKIISKHIEQGNIIISDLWPAYNFLDDTNSVYRHITHNHLNGSFGVVANSSAYIENSWANLKDKIKKLYHNIPNRNFILFLKESE